MERDFSTKAILRSIQETINRGNVNRATFNTHVGAQRIKVAN